MAVVTRPLQQGDGVTAATAATTRTWQVTAPHRRVSWAGREAFEVPFGTAHLRRLNAASTACGAPALTWPIFWGLSLEQVTRPCLPCLRAAGQPVPPIHQGR